MVAELAGTNQIIARTKVNKDGSFVLSLPAVATPNSTLYDFYVAGNGAYVVRSQVAVSSQGGASTPPLTNLDTLSVTTSTFGSISGKISDACSLATKPTPVQAATLQLLVPDRSKGGSTCDYTRSSPAIPSNCVVVASAATDEVGHYPLPATPKLSQAFSHIPFKLPEGIDDYDLEISAPGFNTTVQEVGKSKKGFDCPTSAAKNKVCSFGLEHGFLRGSTSLKHPNNSPNSLDLMYYQLRVISCGIILAVITAMAAGCNGFGVGQASNPGSTPNIASQTSYRIVGAIGTPFQAVISDSRSSWLVSGTIPTSIVIVNDSPPDRILVNKLTNDSRLLSLEVITGFSVITLDSTVSNFGSAVGSVGGKLPSIAPPASPDVRFYVKNPMIGLFTGLIEDETMGFAIMSRIPAVILFDSPNGGHSGRVDGIFNQVSFAGVFDIDLTIDGRLVASVSRNGTSAVVKGG